MTRSQVFIIAVAVVGFVALVITIPLAIRLRRKATRGLLSAPKPPARRLTIVVDQPRLAAWRPSQLEAPSERVHAAL